jgi:DNA-binding NtrC family response regulator
MTEQQAPKILVIDDEEDLRWMLSRVLVHCGYRVVAMASGELGIERAKSEDFDAVICDIMMPGMGGPATLKALKEIQPATEVIIATGYPDSEDTAECGRLGAFGYLFKPYELDPLREILEKAVQSKRAKQSTVSHVD